MNIISIGGGGFSSNPNKLEIEEYILNISESKKPKVSFFATASGDSDFYIKKFYQAFNKLNCIPSHFSLFDLHNVKFKDYILKQNIVYVGGGNIKSMICLWKEWGVIKILKEAYLNNGLILSGMSAGSLCWFEDFVIGESYGSNTIFKGLNLINMVNIVHYDKVIVELEDLFFEAIRKSSNKNGIAIEDGVAVHFKGGVYNNIVKQQVKNNAYSFTLNKDDSLNKLLLK